VWAPGATANATNECGSIDFVSDGPQARQWDRIHVAPFRPMGAGAVGFVSTSSHPENQRRTVSAKASTADCVTSACEQPGLHR
jgi:hypothetical protein